jgi:hypothetical protein
MPTPRVQTYDWGLAIREQAEPTRIHWAAIFGDVDHQIERVWGGLRVTLTYVVRRGGANSGRTAVPDRGREALNTLVRQKLRALLDDRRFLVRGGTLAFPAFTKTRAFSASSDRCPVKRCPP